MTFDIQTFLASALAMLQSGFSTEWPHVKDIAFGFVADKKPRLAELTQGLVAGEFDNAFFLERIKDEAAILESEAAALAVVGDAKAEAIANTFATFALQTVLSFLQMQP